MDKVHALCLLWKPRATSGKLKKSSLEKLSPRDGGQSSRILYAFYPNRLNERYSKKFLSFNLFTGFHP
jgi:hypothetical protein